ncbi:MAG: carboxypeptidase-like regulatory domain-containing protein [Desulfobacteraceae bacterium]|nr:carboxypeptidase-like regulatory domain-containing protein [Desulfobacteraceae bacterium]
MTSFRGTSAYLSGHISDKDTGEPVEAAKIKTGADMSAISLINGTFNMRHDAGIYILTAEADGYETYSAEIEIRETGT